MELPTQPESSRIVLTQDEHAVELAIPANGPTRHNTKMLKAAIGALALGVALVVVPVCISLPLHAEPEFAACAAFSICPILVLIGVIYIAVALNDRKRSAVIRVDAESFEIKLETLFSKHNDRLQAHQIDRVDCLVRPGKNPNTAAVLRVKNTGGVSWTYLRGNSIEDLEWMAAVVTAVLNGSK